MVSQVCTKEIATVAIRQLDAVNTLSQEAQPHIADRCISPNGLVDSGANVE